MSLSCRILGGLRCTGCSYQWKEWCPIIGVSGRNSAPSLVSVGGMVPHHWCQWKEWCPIIGVSGKNNIGVSGRNSVIIGVSGRNSAPSLVSVGGIVLHHWY
ncbi:unnamed protein product [Staurois parvus]|uniref:Uncharacterized protein n=1 Tax=Staurois parvus TaxID=386267 RepID=A0ABN9G213_9NEOB|nr:unnamed protein product [Staurois parvus]